MGLRVPHVTSYARAPSSLLFLRSARYPQMPRFLQFLREFLPMPLPLMNHSALALSFVCATHAHSHFCPVTKKTAGFLGFYPLSAAKRSAKYGVGWGKSWGKPSSLLGFLGYCTGWQYFAAAVSFAFRLLLSSCCRHLRGTSPGTAC